VTPCRVKNPVIEATFKWWWPLTFLRLDSRLSYSNVSDGRV